MNSGIRLRGKGSVHFKDEEGRPTTINGDILVNWETVYQQPYLKVLGYRKDQYITREFLMPFSTVIYIEWAEKPT